MNSGVTGSKFTKFLSDVEGSSLVLIRHQRCDRPQRKESMWVFNFRRFRAKNWLLYHSNFLEPSQNECQTDHPQPSVYQKHHKLLLKIGPVHSDNPVKWTNLAVNCSVCCGIPSDVLRNYDAICVIITSETHRALIDSCGSLFECVTGSRSLLMTYCASSMQNCTQSADKTHSHITYNFQ